MLTVKDLNLTLGHKQVLSDINLEIPVEGEIIGIMGPNGAGKSSLLKSIIGEFHATGEVKLNGKDTTSQLKSITYIPQKAQIDLDFPISVEDVIISGAYKDIGWFKFVKSNTKQKLTELLDTLKLTSLRHNQISELSGGQLQRVLIARALMSESDVYFLDEPFVGIDFQSEQLIIQQLQALKAQNKLMLIVHHDLSKASEYFDRIILLNKTVRYFGDSQEAVESDKLNKTFLTNPNDSESNIESV
ncbi:manganese transport system ATP-binding protein [Staphylococcus auricularis]|uniref:Metal ABC transporter ATP-binding protein n=2 Tax=Staphylococcus auricularis TaxID=29379 RepID=A0AAP8PRE8_9STAP|nr:metal ABC transporter ATP-binding protein [Staphylococcus auricularis]MBM0868649.1 metal ABC transporter ATP-binding protein [Staphylococcus auricularis]MCG7341367.1 metal ABC transporter ATP-binding protein [Staphylococcus auricularis]PNZ68450.1 metal ABC transporter ATP-binding protein [Staphylococcus auricularis]QPT05918.1 metal ABC transporter ATP-binding protein [Staphylococcus auricularis]SQJ07096.1 Mn2+/Zn2+ ABC transporter ATPase [Staphylococcus auricularis]